LGGGGTTGTSGTINTGGGGGGSISTGGGAGGSGIVVIAYPNTFSDLASIGVGLTYTKDTTSRAGYIVYIFTAGTGSVSW
jgi:hypothetical protein